MSATEARLLRVDLNRQRWSAESIRDDWCGSYFGGKGLGIRYMLEEVPERVDPLSKDNKLFLMGGPFTGTAIPCSGKLAVISKSPATGTILDCSIGGSFAAEMRFAGYLGIALEGASDRPVIVFVSDDQVEILDAQEYWGKRVSETEFLLREKFGSDASVLCIGPAGENLVPMACICSELYRQAGRGGIGAVMGSKKVKAVVVKGSRGVKVANVRDLLERVRELLKEDVLTDTNLWAYTDGTPLLVGVSQGCGLLPTRNFQEGVFDGYEGLATDAVKAARIAKKACTSCALGCGNYIRLGSLALEGPEYETLAMCGSNVGISDLAVVARFNALCDDWGIDTISAGSTAAFAMELREKGMADLGLQFGRTEEYLELPEKIARREGVGAELSKGVKWLAQKYGGEEFAMHVKGLELPGYDPRGSWGMALAYATADRGGCHLRAWAVGSEAFGGGDPFTCDGKAQLVIDLQDFNSIKFSLIICDFWALSAETLAELVSLVTGRETSPEQLRKAGERIWNLGRLFNVREGFSAVDDIVPRRLLIEPLRAGPAAGKVPGEDRFMGMLAEYYSLRGWDNRGIPTRKKLRDLGIEEALINVLKIPD